MKRSICALAVLALTLSACGGGGAGKTPEATFEKLQSALKSKDWGATFDLVAPSQHAKQEKEFEDGKGKPSSAMIAMMVGIEAEELKKMSYREFSLKLAEKMAEKKPEQFQKLADAKFVDAKVEGGNATVNLEVDGKMVAFPMVREDGRWYMVQLFR